MRFAYLVQTEGALPTVFNGLGGRPDARLFHLTFKTPVEGAIHFPASTWTEGRNRLLAEARECGEAFDYYIFSDDDVAFRQGSWAVFEQALERHRPAIGLPAHPHPLRYPEVHAAYEFDAIVNAFHRDLVEDGVLLPYIPDFDAETWWLSQYFVIHMANALYPNGAVKFPAVEIANTVHRDYPRMATTRFSDFDQVYFDLWRDEAYARAHFRPHFATREDPPFPPTFAKSYRLEPAMRDRLRRFSP